MPPRCCPYCQSTFEPSRRRPDQRVCSRPDCQKQRRTEYRREKIRIDPVYAEVVADCRLHWREAHPGYQKTYRQSHPEAVAHNREQQRQRDHKRRIRHLVKNTLVFDLKRSAADVWVLGPLAEDLEKNTLVPSNLLILQRRTALPTAAAAS